MKNQLLLIAALFLMLFSACKKDEPSNPVTPTNPTPTNPYYFKFAFDGTNYNFTNATPQYHFLYIDEVGGYQGGPNLFPSIGLAIKGHSDTMSNSDVMGLVGKTLYFDDTAMRPILTFDPSSSTSDHWDSEETSDHSFFVKITGVSFVKNDNVITYPVRVYVMKGTCSALMSDGFTTTKTLSGGDFNFIVTSQNH